MGEFRPRWGVNVETYQWLAARVDIGSVERMAGHDVDVAGQVLLERLDLGVLARRLAAYDGAQLGGYITCEKWEVLRVHTERLRTRPILGHDLADRGRLDAVDDVVARSRDQVSVAENLHIILEDRRLSTVFFIRVAASNTMRTFPENSSTKVSYLSSLSQAMILWRPQR
jgi:hypothetical protein